MRCNWLVVLSVATVAMFWSCGGAGSTQTNNVSVDSAVAPLTLELPLPDVPETLRTPEERASYVLAHFWDDMDFGDHAYSLDTAFVEQNFVNFAALLPLVPTDTAQAVVDALVSRAATDVEALDMIVETAATYLDHPNSPMRNEELYILFLQSLNAQPRVPDYIQMRAAERLRLAQLNRPGQRGNDFGLVTDGGRATTLHGLLTQGGDTVIVMFYDPDCNHCQAITESVAANDAQLRYGLIAVDVAGDSKRWNETRGTLPERWRKAFATVDIDDGELYSLPALPSFYIFASDGTVVGKDVAL